MMERKPPSQNLTFKQKKLSFTKTNRLLKASEFDNVFKKAERKIFNDYCLLLATSNDKMYSRLGMVVAKKKIPLAKQRNNFKRVIREEFRKNKSKIYKMDIVVLAKENKTKIVKKDLERETKRLLKQLEEKR